MLKVFHIDSIPGALTKAEANELARLADGKVVLEVGSLFGKSTIAMTRTAKIIHSVDWHKGDPHIGSMNSLGDFINNLEKHGVRQRVIVHISLIEDLEFVFAPSIFDFAFIDGFHSYASVKRHIRIVKRCVKPGCCVAFHDYYDNLSFEDFRVKQAIDEEFDVIESHIDTLAVVRLPLQLPVATVSE